MAQWLGTISLTQCACAAASQQLEEEMGRKQFFQQAMLLETAKTAGKSGRHA
jgi:hypothetical protein